MRQEPQFNARDEISVELLLLLSQGCGVCKPTAVCSGFVGARRIGIAIASGVGTRSRRRFQSEVDAALTFRIRWDIKGPDAWLVTRRSGRPSVSSRCEIEQN